MTRYTDTTTIRAVRRHAVSRTIEPRIHRSRAAHTHARAHGRAPESAFITVRACPWVWREKARLLHAHPQRCRFCWRRSSPPPGPEGLSAGSSRGGTSRTVLSVPATWLHVLPLRSWSTVERFFSLDRARAHAHTPQRYTHMWRHDPTDGSLSIVCSFRIKARIESIQSLEHRRFLTSLVIEHRERAVMYQSQVWLYIKWLYRL